jgi:hypothetical protein
MFLVLETVKSPARMVQALAAIDRRTIKRVVKRFCTIDASCFPKVIEKNSLNEENLNGLFDFR